MIDWADCFVIGSKVLEIPTVLRRATANQCVVDLVRAAREVDTAAEYHGLGRCLVLVNAGASCSRRCSTGYPS